MPARKAAAAAKAPISVESLFQDHPYNAGIQLLRQIILGADPTIRESIKWNAPSFFTTEHFATFNLHAKDGIQLVLHRGAKPREATERLAIPDPAGLLSWRSPDRAIITLHTIEEITQKQEALVAIVQAWLPYV